MKYLPDLPKELWGLIFQQIDNLLDRLHFGHVCSFFRSVAEENDPCRLSRVLLMLPPFPNSGTRDFFSLADSRIYQVQVPELKDKWCCGSSYGWLFAVDFDSGDINLLNPFTRTQISLPHISTFTNPEKPGFEQERNEILYIRKAIISASPSKTDDFLVMVIFTNLWALAFCRPSDKKWTTLTREYGPCEDVTYYRDKFYAITNWGALIAWDLSIDTAAPMLTILMEPTHELPYFRYLVESPNGELLKISKLEDENARTIGFKVHRLVDQGKIKTWIELNSLDGYAVFLGYNRAICLSTKENPECLSNCIYFTEDNVEKYYFQDVCDDVGVYKLKDGSIDHLYEDHQFWTGHSIWITPSLR